jgi:hypothetical protein
VLLGVYWVDTGIAGLLASTFLSNHARAILACDFFVAVTATFRVLYVFAVIEHGHANWRM